MRNRAAVLAPDEQVEPVGGPPRHAASGPEWVTGHNLSVMEAPRRIQEGTVLIKKGARMPDSWQATLAPYLGWNIVLGQVAAEVPRTVEATGWQFFCVVPVAKASGLSCNPRGAMETAMRKLLLQFAARGLNASEVVDIKTRSFLGLHCVTVSARARQLQESKSLHELKRFHWPKMPWGWGRIPGARGPVITCFKGI